MYKTKLVMGKPHQFTRFFLRLLFNYGEYFGGFCEDGLSKL